jgi:hypothetical protein
MTTTMTMGEMMDATMGEMGLRAVRAYRSSAQTAAVDAWIVDVVTEMSITGTGTGPTFEAALADAVDGARRNARNIAFVMSRSEAV